MKKMYSLGLLFMMVGQVIFAQNSIESIVAKHLQGTTAKSSLTDQDVAEWKIKDIVPSLNPQIKHVYVQQYLMDTPIQFATYKLSVKNNQSVTYEINQFIDDAASKAVTAKSSLTPQSAVLKVAQSHGLPSPVLSAAKSNSDGAVVYENSGISLEPIKVEKVYVLHNDQLRLTWKVSLYQEDGLHWWVENVAVDTGEILHKEDWVISCNFGPADGISEDHSTHNHSKHSILEKIEIGPKTAANAALAPDSYNVYAVPIGSPDEGGRSIVTDPADLTASPFGWHDTNGSAGAEFTITRGNNVWAQDDSNGNNGTGFSPDGGAGLDFNFPINLSQSPSNYREAAITNLFYWNNIMHDVFYQYGFDEASGNFQENNYGRGGAGGDSVNADAQDGSGINNANFSTPGDGGNPRMQMFLWNQTNPGRDGDLDNVIIAHEYGHGISIRLVGGPSSNTLGGSEQMGEGWSDWFGLMLTMKPGDQGSDGRGVGTYVLGQGNNGTGIRPTKYSTSRSINDTDYADIGGLARPHGVGYAFATILWDMTWLLIDQEGFDEDFYNGTGGNNIAMALVIEGLKNTANNPGFVSGRDGILQADQDLYGGAYRCLIWKAFAERGVGEGANENNNGGTNGQTDQTVSFVNPCDGGGPDPDPDCADTITDFPYGESFEGSLGKWTDAKSGDDLDWTITSDGTPSNNTGPSGASDGTQYIYVEASGNGTGFPNKKAILNSPCFDFASVTSPSLSFDYHMLGSTINSLTVEARASIDGDWTIVFSETGAQGSDWNTAKVDLSTYAGETGAQIRFTVVTGSGNQGWQSDIAIDNVKIGEANTIPDPDVCTALDFNDFQILSFSNQDQSGNFSIVGGGSGLSMQDNTWKYIPLSYTVTSNTVIEFDFSSTSQGEIHAVGFENDNNLTSSRYFKVHGTQNYGVTNYDNYSSGTTAYVIPVGSFYTGAMDRLVFINDNDAGFGNNSIFSNVKIYEGSCGGSSFAVTDFGPKTPILGDEDEGLSSIISVAPTHTKDRFAIHVNGKTSGAMNAIIYNILGRKVAQIRLNEGTNEISAKNLSMETAVYLIKIAQEGENPIIHKLIVE